VAGYAGAGRETAVSLPPAHSFGTKTHPNRLFFLMRNLAALLLCLGTAWCADPPRPNRPLDAPATVQIKDIQIPKITRAPSIEEFLGGASRSDMKRVDDFRQRDPQDGTPVSRKTAAWLGYTDKSLFAVFVCDAPPGQVRARMSRREDIFSDDVVGVLIDTYHSHQRGYEFLVNPLGIQADAMESEGSNDDMSFDTLWRTEGRLTPEGFVVLIDIPFHSLRFPAERLQTWGIALARLIPSGNESSFWPYITRKVSGFNQQMANMGGLESISAGRNLRFIPYGAFGQSHYLDSGVPAWASKTDFRGGMDVKAVLHDTLTLDATLNPDFSQVESDDPQVTVNQRYEVQFPEKRPFFLENNAYFSTPETLFFSRRIVDPEFGARLTGKLGRWNLGALAADDRAAGASLGQDDPRRLGRASIGVLRLQREFAKQSNVGVLFTERDFHGSYNRVAAADARFKLNKNWTVSGQAMASATRDLDGARSGGNAYSLNLRRQDRNYTLDWTYTDRSEGFKSELGFIPRVNIRKVEQFVSRRFHPNSKIFLSFGPQLDVLIDADHSGRQQDWLVNPSFDVEMARNTFLGVFHGNRFERFGGINFRRHSDGFYAHTEYFKTATLDMSYSRGTRVNYGTPDGVAPFVGNGSDLQAQVTFRPASRVKIDGIYYLTRLRTRADSFAHAPLTGDGRPAAVFVNHLMRTRLNYQFTRELSLRLIMDYNGVLENPALVAMERQKRFAGDVLLTYLIHPGTALYVGYTDQLENLAFGAGQPPHLYRTGRPSATTGRQLFIKASYLIRL
jgi:hypothetical protein